MPRSASANIDVDTGVQVGAAGPRSRFYYHHKFPKVPILASAMNIPETQTSTADAEIEAALEANLDWVHDGTGTEVVTKAANGGCTLTTGTTTGNNAWLLPNATATITTGLQAMEWDTDNSPAIEWTFTTGASVADVTIAAGFVLTQAAAYSEGTDDDRIQFEYVAGDGTNGNNVVLTYSVNATDYEQPLSFELAASTTYWCKIAVGADRYAECHFGSANDPGSAVHTRTKNALKTGITALKPSILVQANIGSAAKAITVHSVAIGRDYI